MKANIYKDKKGWRLELEMGGVIMVWEWHATKGSAKAAAKRAGAQPWNY